MNQQERMARVRLTALMVVGSLLGALVLTPGVSLAAKFLTKKKADKRYLNVKEVVAAGSTIDTDIDDFFETEFTSLVSAPIIAPSGGVLVIVGQVGASSEALSSPELGLRLRVDGVSVTSGDQGQGFGGEDIEVTNGLTAAVSVAAAHTVHIDGKVAGIGGPVDIHGRSLSVLFVPTGSGVTIPA
jgi:hypothetical protein